MATAISLQKPELSLALIMIATPFPVLAVAVINASKPSSRLVLMPVSDVGIVTYRSTSQRGDQPPYVALITSLYTRRGDVWRLTLHQQTAV